MNLEDISFGDRVAENEAADLTNYFVRTLPWKKLIRGQADVVLGAKGSGKSALYTLLLSSREELRERGIVAISAENPTGKTVFSEIADSPPNSEFDFVCLWKLYICQLSVKWLFDNGLCQSEAQKVYDKLVEIGLFYETSTLKKMLKGAKNLIDKIPSVSSVEAGADPSGGIKGKVSFSYEEKAQENKSLPDVDELLEVLDSHLSESNLKVWILFDRLDVAFEKNPELEAKALRSLFKAYRDIEGLSNINLKIFLRDDIWGRITAEGFREASHITKTVNISWDEKGLLHLIVSRATQNPLLLSSYGKSKDEVMSSHEEQVSFYYTFFPKQVDVGSTKPDTFRWIVKRIRDGLDIKCPRELIHFHSATLDQEIRDREIGSSKARPPNIFSPEAIKEAAKEVSRVRLEKTIYPEHAELIAWISKLENSKAIHNASTLSCIWSLREEDVGEVAMKLAEIGFFEHKRAREKKVFDIPYLYHPGLNLTRGKAFGKSVKKRTTGGGVELL